MEERKKIVEKWFCDLRDDIRKEFIKIEKEYNANFEGEFEVESWDRKGGGGGQISMLNGGIFEKVGVNVSTVYGELSGNFADEIPGAKDSNNEFWASGISLVSHMRSPLVPAVHMNTRMIITKDYWFGGGIDLTPTYYNDDESRFFHSELERVCNKHDTDYYKKFSKWADDYFYIKHREESRGIGGIFYDYINKDWYEDFAFTKDVGRGFLDIYQRIVRRSMFEKYADEQREFQLYKRGRYVEFNLLYDRGTRFGIMTGGNPRAILMSLPPVTKWGMY